METPKYIPKEVKRVYANYTQSKNSAQVVFHAFSLQDYGMTKVQTTSEDFNSDEQPTNTAFNNFNKVDSSITENRNNNA